VHVGPPGSSRSVESGRTTFRAVEGRRAGGSSGGAEGALSAERVPEHHGFSVADGGQGRSMESDDQPREDDRNDELEESPVPDPEEGEPRADDDPQAD